MSSCTIYSRTATPADCITMIAHRAAALGVEVNSMTKESGGQEWTHLILGTHSFVRRRGNPEAHQNVLDHVAETTVAFGIGIGPHDGPVARDKLAILMCGIDSILFDGRTMLNEEFQDLIKYRGD